MNELTASGMGSVIVAVLVAAAIAVKPSAEFRFAEVPQLYSW